MENLNKVQLNFDFEVEIVMPSKKQSISYKKQQDDFVFSFMDCLTSPIIVFKSAWQDTVPKEILKNTTMARMMCVLSKENMASIAEVIAYMMPRTLEAPLPSEWTRIYTWCGLQYAKFFKRKTMAEAMTNIAPIELSQYEQSLLTNLRIWIYNKRREELKASLKKNKKAIPKANKVQQNELFQ